MNLSPVAATSGMGKSEIAYDRQISIPGHYSSSKRTYVRAGVVCRSENWLAQERRLEPEQEPELQRIIS